MKSLVELSVLILQDCGMKCGANPLNDVKTVVRRAEHEGDSFITITLPAFCKAFERALAEGSVLPAHFPSFRRAKGTCLPAFLQGFTRMVFSPGGALLEDPSVSAIEAIRQICLFAKKLEIPCTGARNRAAERKFIGCELEIRQSRAPDSFWHNFKLVSKIVWSDIFRGVPFGNPYEEYRPRHGPGATREGLKGNRKFLFPNWPSRLGKEFPFHEFCTGSVRNLESEVPFQFDELRPRDELPVRVCFVPKTLKTPRVIAVEPVCMQYMQQAISNWLRPRIELLGRYTSGQVNFTSQEINASLALSSSRDGGLATIDMSEASDRVSCKHVWNMLEVLPGFRRQVFSARSTRAQLPSGKIIALRKFASMGSALCFPMEAMAFFCALVSFRIARACKRVTPRSVYFYSRQVYVYGDDIIIPANEAPLLCDDLESFGFKVNFDKSFWTGKFRESCGMDAFDGVPVRPVYCRRPLPTKKTDVHEIVSSVALANQLYQAGLWGSCRWIRSRIENLLGPLPSTDGTSPGLGWDSFSKAVSFRGWSKRYQRHKCLFYVPTPVVRRDPLDGDRALLKCFGLIGSPSVDPEHLSKSVRYGNLALKRRWILV